jgi:predicted ATPase
VSALWAGEWPYRKPQRMMIGIETEMFGFEIACGFPQPSDSRFAYDPQIKEECIWSGSTRKPSTMLLERAAGITTVRDRSGRRVEYPLTLSENESVLSQLREPDRFPELFTIRDEVRAWRFYHTFRTDEQAPVRSPQVSTRTPVLSHDGSDLAAALQTILEVGEAQRLHAAIDAALPGRTLRILASETEGRYKSPRNSELYVALDTEGCRRPLLSRELSDGTLRYLCLVAALLSPRPPSLIALNEPEASLHPDLLGPLAQLIIDASKHSQLWVTTHSLALADAIGQISGIQPHRLQLLNGETVLQTTESDC